MLAIADQLRLDEFSVVGRSGGGPHALACAAIIGEQVRSATVLVGIAPSDATGLDWFDGMTESNVEEYGLASRDDSSAVVADLTERAERIRDDPQVLLRELEREMSEADRRIVSDVAIRRQLKAAYKEALKCGPYGWIDDVLAFRRAWGFDLTKIQVPVRLWHGLDDVFSPCPPRALAEEAHPKRGDRRPAGSGSFHRHGDPAPGPGPAEGRQHRP